MKENKESVLSVIVVAHPDDESMFFVPTIYAMRQHSRAAVLWLLCLTTGDYDGLGKVRSKELVRTGKDILGFDNVLLCDDDKIRDDPKQAWDIRHAASLIQRTLQNALHENDSDKKFSKIELITFDEMGVSGHINHRDTYLACRALRFQRLSRQEWNPKYETLPPLEMWSLISETNVLQKYIPMLAWMYLLLTWCGIMQQSTTTTTMSPKTANKAQPHECMMIIHRLHYPNLNWRAMASHASQFVWYRRLFVVFSSYTYVNYLQRQDSDAAS